MSQNEEIRRSCFAYAAETRSRVTWTLNMFVINVFLKQSVAASPLHLRSTTPVFWLLRSVMAVGGAQNWRDWKNKLSFYWKQNQQNLQLIFLQKLMWMSKHVYSYSQYSRSVFNSSLLSFSLLHLPFVVVVFYKHILLISFIGILLFWFVNVLSF